MSEISFTTLPSGLRVVSENVPGARSICTGVWVGVGSRDEPAEHCGVSHFLEHLLFKGTESRSAREINEAVDRVGGDMNAFTTKEYTAYYARLPAGELSLGIELLGDVLTAPALRDADIDNERHVILEELAMDDDTPEDRVHSVLFEALYPDHPLGRETAGERETVEAIAYDDVRAFFHHWYRPGNFVLAAAGDVTHERLVELAGKAFAGATGGERPVRVSPNSRPTRLSVLRRKTEQVHMALGWRGVPRDDPDREAAEVVNHVLGGGMASRLFEEIREQRGLAYSVYSSLVAYADAGALTVYVGTAPDHLDEVLSLVEREVEHLGADGVTADELDVAIGSLTGSYVLGLEDPSSRMARLGGQVTSFGEVRSIDDQLARYRAVTGDAVGAVAKRLLTGDVALAALGPVNRKVLAGRGRVSKPS
ncbi:MAG: pitrilysin family protein [Acidimicrobiales bacterium]